MAQNDLDLPDVLDGWVIAGPGLNVDQNDYSVPGYYIMDIRTADSYDAGHIKGAVNVALADVIDQAPEANGQPILVVCYTGQTAARAVGALRMMGYEAKSLKWGMAGWHNFFEGPWEGNAGDYSSPNWLTTGAPPEVAELPTYASPQVKTGETDGAAILRNRVRAMLQINAWGVNKEDVLGSPENYLVNNKWSVNSWNTFGHIKDAIRLDEDLKISGLRYLDPNQTIVTYCYTGQTSAITTAWLNVLGFDTAKSLKFGANAIVHSQMVNSSVKAKTWNGEGAGNGLNFGYYDSQGNFYGPQPN